MTTLCDRNTVHTNPKDQHSKSIIAYKIYIYIYNSRFQHINRRIIKDFFLKQLHSTPHTVTYLLSWKSNDCIKRNQNIYNYFLISCPNKYYDFDGLETLFKLML